MSSRDAVFREIGEALFLAQTLELNISALITIMNQHYHAGMESTQWIVGDDKRTLGRLIQEIQKRASLDQASVDALAEALDARNYVAHQFFVRNISSVTDKDKSAEAVTSIQALSKRIAIGTAITSAFVQGFCKALKIDQADVLIRQDS